MLYATKSYTPYYTWYDYSVGVYFLVVTVGIFVVIQFYNSCKYDCCLAAVSRLGCCVRIVRSLVHGSTCAFGTVGTAVKQID